MSEIHEIDPIKMQIDGFLDLVNEVNRIPNVKINLNQQEVDPQRDALAFVVHAIFQQFKDQHPELAIHQLPIKVSAWNTPPDPPKATSSLLELIRHLFEYRVIELLETGVTDTEKENLKALHMLYKATTDFLLKHSEPGQPIYFGGISRALLPEWYLKQYKSA